jgi:cytidylate kinase
MIIAIDGPAGAGKSTVARGVADALGLQFLDTGAMYRAITLVVLDRGVHPGDDEACTAIARSTVLTFDGEGRIEVDGRLGEPDIRTATVTLNVSAVSAHPRVREAIVARQREIGGELSAAGGGLVVEGRDTTTVVFPDADHKFFLDAGVTERARRRALQEDRLHELERIQGDIERRDRLDTTRAHSPLRKAADAEVIESDGLDAGQVVEAILQRVRAGSGASELGRA